MAKARLLLFLVRCCRPHELDDVMAGDGIIVTRNILKSDDDIIIIADGRMKELGTFLQLEIKLIQRLGQGSWGY
jgi:hypothetical protein